MTKIKVNQNTTAIDVAFNLSGSLAGFPAVLYQLPVTARIGFIEMPELWEDIDEISQTWTPNIQGMELDLTVPIYNPLAMSKAPYTTALTEIQSAVDYGNEMLRLMETLKTPDGIEALEIPVGFNLRGLTVEFTHTEIPVQRNASGEPPFPAFFCTSENYDGEITCQPSYSSATTAYNIIECSSRSQRYTTMFSGVSNVWVRTIFKFDDYNYVVRKNTLADAPFPEGYWNFSYCRVKKI